MDSFVAINLKKPQMRKLTKSYFKENERGLFATTYCGWEVRKLWHCSKNSPIIFFSICFVLRSSVTCCDIPRRSVTFHEHVPPWMYSIHPEVRSWNETSRFNNNDMECHKASKEFQFKNTCFWHLSEMFCLSCYNTLKRYLFYSNHCDYLDPEGFDLYLIARYTLLPEREIFRRVI